MGKAAAGVSCPALAPYVEESSGVPTRGGAAYRFGNNEAFDRAAGRMPAWPLAQRSAKFAQNLVNAPIPPRYLPVRGEPAPDLIRGRLACGARKRVGSAEHQRLIENTHPAAPNSGVPEFGQR